MKYFSFKKILTIGFFIIITLWLFSSFSNKAYAVICNESICPCGCVEGTKSCDSCCVNDCLCGCTPNQLGGRCKTCPATATPIPTITNTPTPTKTPTPTTPPGTCTKKAQGDANCDGIINLLDFEAWRAEYTGGVTTKTADFNSDTSVNLVDFEIWRVTFIAQ